MFEEYEILDTLGEGTFGKVKLARHQNNYYAVKFSTESQAYSSEVLKKIFEKEAVILRQIDHPNTIRLVEIVINGQYRRSDSNQVESRSALVFEYAPYSLAEILELGELQESVCRTIFHQLLQGVNYLHSRNIIHRDLKPQNLLFDSNYVLKICDFGLSTKINNESKPKTFCGSDSFKSPEMLMRKNYNGVMNDLFAVGVTLFILMTGKAPFTSATPNAGLYQFIALNYPDKFWKVHDKKAKYSVHFKNLINSMLAFDPTHRLSIPEILSHPWMKEDTLMGEDLYVKLNAKKEEVNNKKRKTAYKSLKNREPLVLENKFNRSSSDIIENSLIKKAVYSPALAKISDRMVPSLDRIEELQCLFEKLGKVQVTKEGQIFVVKTVKDEIDSDILGNLKEGEEQRLKIQVFVQKMDEETDCLKFKMVEGNIGDYMKVLREFDQKAIGFEEAL